VSRSLDELPFARVWVVDFEFIPHPGEPYDVVCLCALELKSGTSVRLSRDKMGAAAPYEIDENSLFIAFAAHAELGCHCALDWPLPVNILDLHAEFRLLMNGRINPAKPLEGVAGSLLAALQFYGLPGIGAITKDAMRGRILQGPPFSVGEQIGILDYCQSDIDALAGLLPHMLPEIRLDHALLRGRFVRSSTGMQHRGIPIDREIWGQLSDEAAWEQLRAAAIPAVDADFHVYEDGSFRLQLFENYLDRAEIPWPRLPSGQLDLKRSTFREMAKAHPQVAPVYELRHHVSDLRRLKLAVGRDGRNRTVLWPFSSKTSRSQPKASEYIFGPSCWLRSLIKPEHDQAVAYVDLSSAEFGIAAALSHDERMLGVYRSGDPYLGCAKIFGMAPPEATKTTHAELRDVFKVVLLACQYGIQAEGLASRLGISTIAAAELLAQHCWHFPQYWSWSNGWFERTCTTGLMVSTFGWVMRLERPVKERTIRNWPIQTNGADILRIACVLADRIGVRTLAPVHDAVLVESAVDTIEQETVRMRECLSRASRIVLDPDGALGGFELRTDAKIVRYPERYVDPRGERMWGVVTGLLRDLKVKGVLAA
jgi:hypothetical protein